MWITYRTFHSLKNRTMFPSIIFIFFYYIAVIGLVIYIFYKMIDGWINKGIAVRKEQNELLKEILEVMKEKK